MCSSFRSGQCIGTIPRHGRPVTALDDFLISSFCIRPCSAMTVEVHTPCPDPPDTKVPGPMGFSPLPTIRQTVNAKATQRATQKAMHKATQKAHLILHLDDLLAPSLSSSSFSPSSLGTVLPTPVLLRKSSTAGLHFSSTKSSDTRTCPFRFLVFFRTSPHRMACWDFHFLQLLNKCS